MMLFSIADYPELCDVGTESFNTTNWALTGFYKYIIEFWTFHVLKHKQRSISLPQGCDNSM